MQKFIGTIYQAINIQNRKSYIGQTVKDFNFYKKQHIDNALNNRDNNKKYFYKAIRKYGIGNFKWVILGEIKTDSKQELKQALNEAEKESIRVFQSNNSLYGYNMTQGGDGTLGYYPSEETKKKKNKKLKGKTRTIEQRNNISRGKKGRKHSEQHRINISKAQKGKKQTQETINKRVAKLKGVKKSPEHIKKIADKNRGRKATPEEIEKNRQWHKGRTGELCPNSKKVYQYDLQGNFIKSYDAVAEAQRITGINNIGVVVLEKQKTAGDYFWTYKNLGGKIDLKIEYNYFDNSKKIGKFDENNTLIKVYHSILEAKQENKGDINNSLKKGCLTKQGNYWKYV